MADFKTVWDKAVKGDDLPDVIASLSTKSLNNILSVHRNKAGDKDLYQREEKFLDGAGTSLFTALVIVGGDKAEHAAGKAKPLNLELLDAPPALVEADTGYVYEYPSDMASGRAVPEAANAIITAEEVNFYFEWPSSTGGPKWSTHLSDIKFVMDVALHQVEVITDDGQIQQAVEIKPVRLRVSKVTIASIREHLEFAGEDQKVQDLFFALLNYIASAVGPNLVKTISFPVLEVSEYEVLPMLFNVSKTAVTIGAKLNLSGRAEALGTRIKSLESGFWAEVDADLVEAALNGTLDTEKDIEFPRASAFVRSYRKSIGDQRNQQISRAGQPSTDGDTTTTTTTENLIAVAMNEFLFDAIVSKFGNVNKEGRTSTVNLVVVKGCLGYELRVGAIDITVGSGGITGSTPINVFGGAYYRLRQVKDCKVTWSNEKKAGLGIKGSPKITLKTRSSSGLSVHADFDLNGLQFYTGLGFPIDDILKKLSKPLMDLVEAVLDTIAFGISFVVIPVKFQIPGQKTAISFQKFVTGQYKHPTGGTSTRNNFASFTAESAAS